MKNIPEKFLDLFKDETRAFLYLATTMPDGSPQVTPVWFDADDTHILINTARDRVKEKNMGARPNVAICIQDPANPYRYLQVRGQVVEITEDGADEHIDRLAVKYTGKKYANRRPGERRVTCRILPGKVDAH
jgi:PPOX class probable F420-dependent enzyme